MRSRRPNGHGTKAVNTRRGDLIWYKGYKYIVSDRMEKTSEGSMVVVYRQTKKLIPMNATVVLSKFRPF